MSNYINKAFEALGEKIASLETSVSINKFTIEALKKENEELKAENDTLKGENAKLQEFLTPFSTNEPKIALYKGESGNE